MFAAILAGGKGTRLGRVEKGLLRIGGKRIIEYIFQALEGFEKVVVCRDEEQARLYSLYGATITDTLKGLGPLSGIHAALNYFKYPVLVVSSDMPFLNSEICRKIFNECMDADAVIPIWKDGKVEPTLAAYSTKVVPEIERCFKSGERRVIKAIEKLERVKFYPIEELRKYDKDLLTFMNVNTPGDLRLAEEIRRKKDLGLKL